MQETDTILPDSIQAESVERMADDLKRGGNTLARIMIAMGNAWIDAYQQGVKYGYHDAEFSIQAYQMIADYDTSYASEDWTVDALKALAANRPGDRDRDADTDDLPI